MTIIAPVDGPWVDAWLSKERLARYLTAAKNDRELALALYEWNAQLGAALQRDLAHLEIALRNAYAEAIRSHWTGSTHWTSSPAQLFAPLYRRKGKNTVDVNERSRENLARALRDAGPGSAPGKVVAELSFGFWRYLSSAAHEKTLWLPYLHHAFPPGTNRGPQVDAPVGRLHQLRNRVAHHEPLLNEDVAARLQDLLNVAKLLEPQLRTHLAATTQVTTLLAAKPRAISTPPTT